MSYTLFEHQAAAIPKLTSWENNTPFSDDIGELHTPENARGGILAFRMGLGKCSARDTPIIMWDGNIKMVQDVKVGDVICGDDSTPRNILSLARGREKMYKIVPTKGDSYTVNKSHILSLKVTGNKSIYWLSAIEQYACTWLDHSTFKIKSKLLGDNIEIAEEFIKTIDSDDIVDINVEKYLALPKGVRNRLLGFRCGVNWDHQDVDLDPYVLGLWLGDGTTLRPEITNSDPEIIEYLKKWSVSKGYVMKPKKSDPLKYYIKDGFQKDLRKLDLVGNKHIPLIYKRNSRETRLLVLAGLIDTDGYLSGGCYDIVQKKKVLANDILFLARSLGFSAYMSDSYKAATNGTNPKEKKLYHRITISGNINEIPVRVERRKYQERGQKKDVLVTPIKVEELGEDDYYGFMIDGNSRYLLGDFTVTHNTVTSLHYLYTNKNKYKSNLIICPLTIINVWEKELKEHFKDLRYFIYHANYDGKEVNFGEYDIIITTYETILAEFKQANPKCFIVKRTNFNASAVDHLCDAKEVKTMKGKIVTVTKCDPKNRSNNLFYGNDWDMIIADEAHKFANLTTKTNRAMIALRGNYYLCLTGTPISNYDKDIYSLFRFIGIFLYPCDWNNTFYDAYKLKERILDVQYSETTIKLPELEYNTIKLEFSDKEKMIYNKLIDKLEDSLNQFESGEATYAAPLSMFTRLRQICVAPYLIKNELEDSSGLDEFKEYILNKHNIRESTKIKKIVELLKTFDKTDKAIIFCNFASCFKHIKKVIKTTKCLIMDKDTKIDDRTAICEQFNNDDRYNVLLCSYKVGGCGLNLAKANHVILLDLAWNNATEEQAIFRAHRIGQERVVHVHSLIIKDSYELRMIEIQKSKKQIEEEYLSKSSGFRFKHKDDTTKDLIKYIRGKRMSISDESGGISTKSKKKQSA